MLVLDELFLFLHVFFAIIFIGGSFFIWMVVWPESYNLTEDEWQRTRIVGKIAKRFAYFTHISIIILVITGILNANWYLGGKPSNLLNTAGGEVLLIKSIVVAVDIAIIYINNLYHGKRIMKLSQAGRHDEVKKLRKVTHFFSFVSMGLLVVIVILGTLLQFF